MDYQPTTPSSKSGFSFKNQALTIIGILVILWGLEIADAIVPGNWLDSLGVLPRTLSGLRGILFAPFLHADFQHLANNSMPLAVLGWLILLGGLRYFLRATVIIMLVAGCGTWMFGSTGLHFGASGVVYGYLGFLLFRGVFEKSGRAILIALAVGFAYTGMIYGVLKIQAGVSWSSHLYGFIGGAVAAWLLKRTPEELPRWGK